MSKRAVELILLSAFLILAVLLYRSTASYPVSVQGSTANYVRFLAISLGILCTAELALCGFSFGQVSEKISMSKAPIKFWGLFIELVVYSIALEPIGFYMASALFLPIAMVTLGARRKSYIVFTSASVLLFVYLVFEKLLTVPLPERVWFT